jgi:hypothetical protein
MSKNNAKEAAAPCVIGEELLRTVQPGREGKSPTVEGQKVYCWHREWAIWEWRVDEGWERLFLGGKEAADAIVCKLIQCGSPRPDALLWCDAAFDPRED